MDFLGDALTIPEIELPDLAAKLGALSMPEIDLDGLFGESRQSRADAAIERRAASGDVWEAGRHRVYVTDSRVSEVAQDVAEWSPDTTVVDPPFAWQEAYRFVPPVHAGALIVFSDAFRVVDAAVALRDAGWVFRWELVWDGLSSWFSEGRPLARHKVALVCGDFAWDFEAARYMTPQRAEKRLSTVYALANNGVENSHPHAKPAAWVQAMIAGVRSRRVWDPCMGSGTTVIAAHRLGIEGRAADLDPYAADVALHRLEREGLEVRRVGAVEARGAPKEDTDTRYARSKYYRSAAWRRLRRIALRRDSYRCQQCGAEPGEAGLQVDHIVPREDGGPDLPANLRTLCVACHGRKTLS